MEPQCTGADDCPNPARRAGLCWTHYWRRKRGKQMSAPVHEGRGRHLSPWDNAVHAFQDYETAQEAIACPEANAVAERARDRLRKAMAGYAAWLWRRRRQRACGR